MQKKLRALHKTFFTGKIALYRTKVGPVSLLFFLNYREFLVIAKVEKKQEICGVFWGFSRNFPNWENATKTNVGFK